MQKVSHKHQYEQAKGAVVPASDEAFIDLAPDKNSHTDQVIVKSVAFSLGSCTHLLGSGLVLWGVITYDGKSQILFSAKRVNINSTIICTMMEECLNWAC